MLNHIFVEQHSAVHLLVEPYVQFSNISFKRLNPLRKKYSTKLKTVLSLSCLKIALNCRPRIKINWERGLTFENLPQASDFAFVIQIWMRHVGKKTSSKLHKCQCITSNSCLVHNVFYCKGLLNAGQSYEARCRLVSLCKPSKQLDGSPSRKLSGNFRLASALYK